MKRFTKLLSLMLFVTMILTLVAGCTGTTMPAGTTLPGATTAAGTAKPVKMETIQVWSDNAHEKALRTQQIETFNIGKGKELGIKIEYTVYGTNFKDARLLAAQSGEAPHLYRVTEDILPDFVRQGFIIPVADLPGGAEWITKTYPGEDPLKFGNKCVYEGKVYTLPYSLTTYKLVVNNDLFKKAGIVDAAGKAKYPANWAEIRDAAKKITAAGKGVEFGYILAGQSSWTLSVGLTKLVANSIGYNTFNPQTLKYDYNVYEPVMTSIRGMITDGSMFPGYEGLDADAARAQFAEGRVGMIWAASFDVGVYNDQFPAKCSWTAIVPPVLTSGGKQYKEMVDVTALLSVGKKAMDLPDKSMEVFKFFHDDKNLAQMYEEALYIPYKADVIKLATKQPTKVGFAEFSNVPQKGIFMPPPNALITLETETFDKSFAKMFSGEYKDITASLKTLTDQYNAALAKADAAQLDGYKDMTDYSLK